ncbi:MULTISPECIES: DUF2332 domain-containing protein [Actinokineospora]|uniref:DUF2332 domain-containing protein n=1 Tax=Actinokineospora fastidiosa TaxID=1816 RepID=A0A918G1U7_9PSEU|nr:MULTISPECIES: DUF2332 domain-containing protein [Actinokineospora]UVS77167.1 hypothetical protein Actkin_00869 [Actinokineospora sp. UTMC 2448]GGS13001.1 hypothetical protein GCM10010171_00910 [Actinokineospora fastidiosa]
MATAQLDEIRFRLRAFADTEAAGESPLYAHLAGRAADDPDVAALLSSAPPEQARPTLLLAAAHRVLQANPFHELVNYYPSMGGTYGLDGGTWPLFRSFVLDHADAVRALIATRSTQTNEVRRAALLYPALAIAAKQAKGPVGLLEVGCSAGLLLGVDRYAYRYQTELSGQVVAGPAKTPVGLHCALELAPGATMPVLPKKLALAARIGLDRSPVDLDDEDAVAWLEACVWADQPERQRLLTTAITLLRKDPPPVIAGDAVDDLGVAADRVPDDVPLVVLTSNVLPYLSEQRRGLFIEALAELAGRRPTWWLSHEGYQAGLSLLVPDRGDLAASPGTGAFGLLGLTTWEGGRPKTAVLARTAMHGERLTWLA